MKFSSTITNRRDNTYNYQTPVKKLGFDKISMYEDEEIPDSEIREMTQVNDINSNYEKFEKGILEELDLQIPSIKRRIMSVLSLIELKDRNIIESTDMFVPSLIFIFYISNLYFLNLLNLTYLYLVLTIGTLTIFYIINLMSKESVSLYKTISILIYCLLPTSFLSLLATIFTLNSLLGYLVSIACVLYSSTIATKFFMIYLSISDKDLLIFYPCILFYTCFTLILF